MIGRIFRVVRTSVTLLILFGVLLYGAWWGYDNIIRPIPPLPPSRASSRVGLEGQLKASRSSSGVQRRRPQGSGGRCGPKPTEQGLRVVHTDNTVEKIQKTVIVGADGDNPEVLFVKSFFEADVRS